MANLEKEVPGFKAESRDEAKTLIHEIMDFGPQQFHTFAANHLAEELPVPGLVLYGNQGDRFSAKGAPASPGRAEQNQVAQAVPPVFEHPANLPQDINANVVKQGDLGDCYFLASLASLAQQHPEAVKRMIKTNDQNK